MRPLRPIDFLLPWGGLASQETAEESDVEIEDDINDPEFRINLSQNALSRSHTKISQLLEMFKKFWHSHYLLSLRDRHRFVEKFGPDPHPGDLVLLQQQDTHRSTWKMGRVLSLLVSEDGQTRTALVETMSRDGEKKSTLRRATSMLYLLETASDNDFYLSRQNSNNSLTSNYKSPSRDNDESSANNSNNLNNPNNSTNSQNSPNFSNSNFSQKSQSLLNSNISPNSQNLSQNLSTGDLDVNNVPNDTIIAPAPAQPIKTRSGRIIKKPQNFADQIFWNLEIPPEYLNNLSNLIPTPEATAKTMSAGPSGGPQQLAAAALAHGPPADDDEYDELENTKNVFRLWR